MRDHRPYTILRASNTRQLENLVIEHIKLGYVPNGDLVVFKTASANQVTDVIDYMQPMIWNPMLAADLVASSPLTELLESE